MTPQERVQTILLSKSVLKNKELANKIGFTIGVEPVAQKTKKGESYAKDTK